MNKKNYELWHTTPLTREQFEILDQKEKLLYLCKLGQLAPSTHNTQPWRFFINQDDGFIDIYADRHHILSESDVAGRQTLVSMGCAIENMAVGASFLHARPTIKIVATQKTSIAPGDKKFSQERYAYLARLEYTTKSKPLEYEDLYKSIFTRKVTRAEYDPLCPLPSDVMKELNAVTDGKTTKLHIITDAMRRLGISEFQGQADGFVINSPRFSRELGEWLLPNETESFLGMPGAGFGLSDDEAVRIHQGLVGKSRLQPEDGLKFALAGKTGMEKSPFIGCITIPKDKIGNWIEAGRALEHMFLILESHGISVAIHAGIIEVPLINKIFAASLGTLRKPAVLFRAGFMKYQKDRERPHSPRLSIDDVILSSDPQG